MTSEEILQKKTAQWSKMAKQMLTPGNTTKPGLMPADMSNSSEAIFELLESGYASDIVNDICNQLVAMFRSQRRELCLMVFEFVPCLIWAYLSMASKGKTKAAVALEACLLTLYNLNVVDGKGKPFTRKITIPSLGKNSIYHETSSLGSLILTETALSRYETGEKQLLVGPFSPVEKLCTKNRLHVLSHLIRCYIYDIGNLSTRSHHSLCDMAVKICCTGFSTERSTPSAASSDSSRPLPRILVSPELLSEALHCVYFIMFNGQPEIGLEALEAIHFRANYELYPSTLLVTNAIKNSLEHNPSGQPIDGPMGISIAITPACILNNLNKDAITNASFRTTILPEDITPEAEPSVALEEDSRNMGAANEKGKLFGGLRLSARPLKNAFKRVEKSIALKKISVEKKDTSATPGKLDHGKVMRTASGSSGRYADSPTSPDYMAGSITNGDRANSSSTLTFAECSEEFNRKDSLNTLNHENIEILIDQAGSDNENSPNGLENNAITTSL